MVEICGKTKMADRLFPDDFRNAHEKQTETVKTRRTQVRVAKFSFFVDICQYNGNIVGENETPKSC